MKSGANSTDLKNQKKNKKSAHQPACHPKTCTSDAQPSKRGKTPWVGSNQHENHQLLLQAAPNDWWVHASDHPSAHGMLPAGRFDRKAVVATCLQIKQQSKRLKKMQRVAFTVTKRKHLELTGVPGEVIVKKVLREVVV